MQQGFFEAGIAALEGLDIIQTISLYRILERSAEPFVLPSQRGEPVEMKPQAEAVALAGFHQVLLVEKPADESRIEPPVALPVHFDMGHVSGGILLNVRFHQAVFCRIKVQHLFRRNGDG